MGEAKFTPGPWRAERIPGWGNAISILAGDSREPLFNSIKPKAYYTDFAPGSQPGSVILSDEIARKQGRYVATDEIRRALDAEEAANATIVAAAPDFAGIASRAQHLANERGGDYGDLTKDELCAFMVEYDAALTKASGH